jgi:pathogenesis-related protein 1
VKAHNRVRARLGIGPVRWSSQLAAYAQRWADHLARRRKCALIHRKGGRYGENLALWGGTGALQRSAARAVSQWEGERRIWNRSRTFTPASLRAGHYTQVIWRQSTEIGCGRAACGDTVVVVCNYNPAGNTLGGRIY